MLLARSLSFLGAGALLAGPALAQTTVTRSEAVVQAVFYQSKDGFTGSDEVTVDVKDSDGNVQIQNIKITVGAAKPDAAKKELTDL